MRSVSVCLFDVVAEAFHDNIEAVNQDGNKSNLAPVKRLATADDWLRQQAKRKAASI